jgi:drug/metabolite transporter (DMT)-like permease
MTPLSDNMRGAVFMMLSMAGFSLNDAFLKTVAGELPLFQAVFLRGLIVVALTGALGWSQGAFAYRPGRRDRRLIGWRCLGEIGGTICFLTALFNMPIANASAILQSVPLAVTLGAALFLGEPVGWRRYLAIGVGFMGVLVIVRPGAEGFNAYALWAVAAIGFIVVRDLSTRSLSPGAPALAIVFDRGGGDHGDRRVILSISAAGRRWRRPMSGRCRCRRSACSSAISSGSRPCGSARSGSPSRSATRC